MPEAILVSEPELIVESDQVHEPAPKSVPEGIVDFRILVVFDVMDWSPAHTPVMKEGLLCPVPTEIYDELEDVCSPNLQLPLVPSSLLSPTWAIGSMQPQVSFVAAGSAKPQVSQSLLLC